MICFIIFLYINCECNLHYEKFADGSVKCIEDEIPFEIPKSWAWCRGITCFKGMENKVPEGDLFTYIDIESIDNKEQKISTPKIIHVKSAPSRACRKINKGCILFSLVRPYLKNIAIVDKDYHNPIASSGFYICNPDTILHSEYLFYLMISTYVVNGLNQFMKGDNSPSINKGHIENWLYPIPPLNEQLNISKKVSCLLNTINDLNNNKKNLLKSIDSLKSKILDLAIRGKLVPQDPNDEPADVLLKRIRKEKEELIKQGKIKRDKKESIIFKGDDNSYYEVIGTEKQNISDQINFSLPDNWSISRLQSVCKLCDGIKINGEKLPYLDAKTLRKIKSFEFRTSGEIVFPGTKLILVDGENSGEVFVTDIKGYLGSTFKVLDINKNIKQGFINLILSFYKYIFKENKTGSAVPHLNKKLFKDLIIGIPPLNEQERIVTLVNHTFKILNLIENSLK